ncbi:PREDICTED: uncharacterized protein At1g27050 [Ipomoea nil]|uniref:uncharacterized protein At1g27050 n=1 Tax=Ipomoea nil TaxID=35883 RepID=UPI000900CD81|nr:PREDICTED: uncharacterized protein At1g27050 [Ipomoea nil]
MGRKRDRAYQSRHVPNSFPKRRRPLPPPVDADNAVAANDDLLPENSTGSAKLPTTVVVIGLTAECSVLDLKSRFEIYGAISRTRMDPGGLAHITFRSRESAVSAVSAAADAAFPITLHSEPVQVMWASDPVPQWKEGVAKNEGAMGVSSKLVRAEVPLSRHGRGNKLGSAIVNSKNKHNVDANSSVQKPGGIASRLGVPFNCFKGREIVAYDDIL